MFETFISEALIHLANPWVWLAICGGATIGMFTGALPGLSTTMAIAVIVGFTYDMDLSIAIAFLLSAYTGSVYGGAITAILVNIPGTPDSVPTQMAAWPLTQKGEGGLAVGTALMFSFIGNWIGTISLILLMPYILPIALRFTSWELALVGLLGIIIAGTLAGESRPILGWISGFLGILLASIGREGIHGVQRFTLGLDDLQDGVPFVPVLIGFYGIAELVRALSVGGSSAIPPGIGRILPPWSFYRKYWRTAVRSGAIGTAIGIVPGAGASVSTFVSYKIGESIAGRRFSDGDFEGVVCSEVSDNANIGGSLLPTLALGIPGSASMAMMMGVLVIHGVRVGPQIAETSPGLLEWVYAVLLLANFAMVAAGLLLLKPTMRALQLPVGIVMSVVGVLTLIGSFVGRLRTFDIAVMFVAGIVAHLASKANFPFAPFVLGMVLAPLVDSNLRRALDVYSDDYFTMISRPVAVILLIALIVVIVSSVRSDRLSPAEALLADSSDQRA